ncbi:3-methylitaconate isomerase [Colletotrichum sp. SAR 10_70]|nr:3-methylitaconate isomerase [Colletotrichum sp. SAR 10_71]KAI8197396.1 3-methylitaconate isomerase [Colletotrichum sp. SAR 10_70]KAI8247748.1 3-methylitaconate isomerase [Colletotrichum sp. SAR 10_77]
MASIRALSGRSARPLAQFTTSSIRFSSAASISTKLQTRAQSSLPAAYYRGGTSRAIFFRHEDLPADRSEWDRIFLGSIGSPDPYGRQLDGLGGGISSLSKVCVIRKSDRPDADVDYTFVSLGIKNTNVDYSSNCGNMSAAVGPYAVDSGLVKVPDGATEATVRVFNTNTGKVIESIFPLDGKEAAAHGDFSIDGVAGTAARVQLKFLNPAGSRTGKLFPTEAKVDEIEGMKVTCIDAGNPCIFVQAATLGVEGTITPQGIEDHPTLLQTLDKIRRTAGVKMGLAETKEKVPGSVPKIAIVSPPKDGTINTLVARAMSVDQPHKAIPVTVALAAAAAATAEGTVVSECVKTNAGAGGDVRIFHASGTLDVAADYGKDGFLESATVYRTARRLMEGRVFWK